MTDTSVHSVKVFPAAAAAAAGGPAPASETGFGGLLRSVQQHDGVVKSGDTLIGIVKRHYAGQGQSVGDAQAYRLAHQLARDNGIANPDLILPGQKVSLDRLPVRPQGAATASGEGRTGASSASASGIRALDTVQALRQREPALLQRASIKPYADGGNDRHPVLERTLLRAVQKGFVPPHEVQAVHRRIIDMAEKYRFQPDDFAKVSLMESDGLNPKASNGQCHGIIQFCGGAGRGADSVGFGRKARDILGLSVMQQLDLVERYFDDVGVRQDAGPLKLDDLYLSVLMPSARREQQRDAPLAIAGQQAAKLYVNGQRGGFMTRQSIVEGLVQHARARLSDTPTPARVAQSSTDRSANP